MFLPCKQDATRVLNAELTLLAGLKFQLVTYSPYRSLEGFKHDMEDKVAAGQIVNLTNDQVKACIIEACKIADAQMVRSCYI